MTVIFENKTAKCYSFNVILLIGISNRNICNCPVVFFLFQTGPFALKSPPLSTFHQQLWLVAHIITDNKEGKRAYTCSCETGQF